jgi:type I restriction enzyme S subunit
LGVENSSTRFVRAGATVIASAGQGNTRGQTSLLILDSYINQSTVALVANKSKISDAYLFFDLSGRYEQFRQISDSHSSRGSLTTKLLANIDLISPEPKVINAFDKITNLLIRQVKCNLLQTESLEAARDSLLPKLLSGEIRIKEAEQALGVVA